MDTVKVWPRLMDDGTSAVVRMPERGMAVMPPEGATVPVDFYWVHRLRDRDVVTEDPRPPASAAAPAPSDHPPADEATPSSTQEH